MPDFDHSVLREFAADSDTYAAERVEMLFNNRLPIDWLRELLFRPADYVLFVSISSQHTLTRIRPWFYEGSVKTRHFRVLTWQPKTSDVRDALAWHLGEDPVQVERNLTGARRQWKELEDTNPAVEVYTYRSTPTMQAIVTPEFLKVEIMPFNAPELHQCGSPNSRPALLFKNPSRGFAFFHDAFTDLWLTAMRDTPESDVHSRWRERREALLREHGLA